MKGKVRATKILAAAQCLDEPCVDDIAAYLEGGASDEAELYLLDALDHFYALGEITKEQRVEAYRMVGADPAQLRTVRSGRFH